MDIGVTPFVGVWIEIFVGGEERNYPASLPSWECGLKLFSNTRWRDLWASLPSWECGLKYL